jgi:hypothetical protein
LVVEVCASAIVDIGGKVKFPRGVVVYSGTRDIATAMIHDVKRGAIIGGTSTSGYKSTSTSGDYGTSTSGDYGTSTSGYRGTSTSGNRGTATSGNRGTLVIKHFDGSRYRLRVAYIGEDGIKPNTPYKLDSEGNFVEAGDKE